MTQFQSQVIYGIFIAITGAVIAFLSYNPSRTIQYVVAVGIFFSAVFAFITAAKNKNSDIRLKYHELQGAGMFAYALAILIYASTFESFITITIAFLLYFGITEIVFGFQLMEYKRKISMPVIVLRMITGLLMAVGAVLIFAIAFLDKNVSLLVAGILIVLSGINFILFANATRNLVIQNRQ
jgi:hypothetical protein